MNTNFTAGLFRFRWIKSFYFRMLRLTIRTWLLTSGVDLRTIQNVLAHSDILAAEWYSAVKAEQNEKVVNA